MEPISHPGIRLRPLFITPPLYFKIAAKYMAELLFFPIYPMEYREIMSRGAAAVSTFWRAASFAQPARLPPTRSPRSSRRARHP